MSGNQCPGPGFRSQARSAHEVLERIAQSFEPGVTYPERDVDAMLRAWTDGGGTDHATLRRYLVDHGLLSRRGGEYWRSGGRVDVAD